ncbi:MAG: lysine exporter LysO family protein [Muribaculaceae bacterium]
MKGSFVIVAFFAAGVVASFTGVVRYDVASSDLGFYALGALMTAVGVSVGSDVDMLQRFRALNPRLALLPLCTIVGTMVGSVAVCAMLHHRSLTDCLAVGAGLGYYSLSSIFITEYRGAELGTVALLANIIRELITLLLAPWLVRWFGRLAAISAGGATSMDTTLPVITYVSGKEMVIVSVFHGFVSDFSVPFMVTLWCSL